MASFIHLEEPPRTQPRTFALWALAFRPFYLLASTFAALSIGLWALQFSGWLPRPYLAGPVWHAHEMLFGFTMAVVVGFLFTAGRNWSGRPTPTGPALMALAALWVIHSCGRKFSRQIGRLDNIMKQRSGFCTPWKGENIKIHRGTFLNIQCALTFIKLHLKLLRLRRAGMGEQGVTCDSPG